MSQQPNVGDVTEKARRFSPALFGIIAICFLLPFVALTCSGQELFSLKGLDLVTGTEITEDDLSGQFKDTISQFEEGFGGEETDTSATTTTESDKIDPQIPAIVALAVAVIGLIAGFALRGERGSLVSAIAGIIGVIALLVLRFTFNVDTESSGAATDVAQVDVGYEWRLGWWLALILFLVQPLLHFASLTRLRSRSTTTAPPAAPPS